ncbi:UNC93-like protein MFSD11 [Aphelenchoides avenae]|nr:UNC93-like protein MFSD11 [Aphelenchus avenae]
MSAAVFWSAQGNDPAQNSDEATAGRNAGIFWSITQTCQTLGGVFVLVAFQLMSDTKTISDSSTKVLYGSFFGASVLGVVTLALLRKTPSENPLD